MKKEFENIFKRIKHEEKHFSLHKRDWENSEQNNKSITLNVLFLYSEEITLLYKSELLYNQETFI